MASCLLPNRKPATVVADGPFLGMLFYLDGTVLVAYCEWSSSLDNKNRGMKFRLFFFLWCVIFSSAPGRTQPHQQPNRNHTPRHTVRPRVRTHLARDPATSHPRTLGDAGGGGGGGAGEGAAGSECPGAPHTMPGRVVKGGLWPCCDVTKRVGG